MPTILAADLAEAWLYHNLNDQEILDIANYQVAAGEMMATAPDKDFLKKSNPHEQTIYRRPLRSFIDFSSIKKMSARRKNILCLETACPEKNIF